MSVTEMTMLRWISGVTREDKIKNEYVSGSIGVASIVNKMRENRLKWLGHVMRREETGAVRVVMKMNIEGKRGRGRPKKRWLKNIEKDMRAVGVCIGDDAIKKRSEARIKAIQNPTPENQEEFLTLKNQTNKIIRREKRKAEKEFVSSIEEHRLNPRRFFKKCNSIKKGFNAQLIMLRDDCGYLITDEANIVKKFQTHFKDLLNINQDNNASKEDDPLYYTVQPEITELDEEEIKQIIIMLKNNKAPEEDNINAELIKISTPKMISKIYILINEIWKKRQIPHDWKTAIICTIYKGI
ncbi:hypothetical protein QTP88_023973 [Uroleucon formosanum]